MFFESSIEDPTIKIKKNRLFHILFPTMRAATTEEVYISFDIETLGGNPYIHPMINIGAVAYTAKRVEIGSISINLEWPEGAVADPDTLKWFTESNAEAYARMQINRLPPAVGMAKFRDWCHLMGNKKNPVVFLAYPTVFDGSWLYAYWFRYLGHPANGKGPGFSMTDIRSYGQGVLRLETYAESRKDKALKPFCPKEEDFPHTHEGIDDAREQAQIYFNLRDSEKK